jgi:hypothetical protein
LLVLELPTTYLLGLEKCPAVLKRELPHRPPYLDLVAAVTEAVQRVSTSSFLSRFWTLARLHGLMR